MANYQQSNIAWTDFTWNPWEGCTKVSPGCARCYMYRDFEKFGKNPMAVRRTLPATFNKPLKLKNPAMIFTCSLSDFFIEAADEWRAEAWQIIKDTPHHTYQILTKRPERIAANLPADWGAGYPNVWLGVSAESADYYAHRVTILRDKVPAQLKFISIEPLLGDIVGDHAVDTWASENLRGIDWVIVGGESGHNTGKFAARPCERLWMDKIVFACRLRSVPVFVKQVGTVYARANGFKQKDGKDAAEFPPTLRYQQFPTPAPVYDNKTAEREERLFDSFEYNTNTDRF